MKQEPTTANRDQPAREQLPRELTHEETLEWISSHRAWRRARKTEPIWARIVTADEIGKGFQTADRAVEIAREGAWLCVGVAHEPWFQSLEKIEAKYHHETQAAKQFAFDDKPHQYQLFRPKPVVLNWVACIDEPGLSGFWIRPAYDPDTPLHSARGGYVVKEDASDPYQDGNNDAWLVQKSLFERTYEFLPEDSGFSNTLETGDVR